MPEFSLIDAKWHHCGRMARVLRDEHRELVAGLGYGVHRELHNAFARSSLVKAWLIDGELAAIGGLETTLMSSEATVWLAMSDEATKHPLALVRMLRRQIGGLVPMKRVLSTVLIRADAPAIRLAEFLGFQVDANAALGCTMGALRLQEAA